jgi:hypothetical protein
MDLMQAGWAIGLFQASEAMIDDFNTGSEIAVEKPGAVDVHSI